MKRINLLDENTSNKIAAGEVVERPSSVVKELVENSIDANSKNITVEIEEGGKTLIRVVDDGDGIHPDDIKKAFLPHATSKIKNSEDIYKISTLGFRGEALPSIASVSKVNIKSRIETQDFGKELIIESGEIIGESQCGTNKGTTIEVRDIFYNVPARKKFLKTTSRESSIISDIINRIAISNPNISFKLFNNGKKVLQTYGTGNLKDTVRSIYGKNVSENLIYFENAEDTITVYGYIGKEEIARGSRNNQTIFVNGRYIKHKTIVAAVENAFKSFSTCNKFPFFILFIEVYPEFVDVNIHPTKAEIKFEDDRLIFKKVFDTVHNALKKDVFDYFELPEEKIIKEEEKVEKLEFDITPSTKDEKVYVSLPIDLKNERIIDNEPIIIKEERFSKSYDNPKKEIKEQEESCNSSEIRETSDVVYTNNDEEIEIKTPKFPPIRIIGQFNKTYILGEYDQTLYLIDQHAAHEKILFEKYLKSIENDNLIVQPLLLPIIIDLSTDDFCVYKENSEVFKNAGFNLEEFGGNSLSLKEVPYFLGKTETKSLLISIIDNLREMGSGKTTEIKYNKIATMACKAAVKGNDELTTDEMVKLIETLRYIDDPFHCPHGRPTIIKMTNYELEKKFRRIV